jgi:hypothetical protein
VVRDNIFERTRPMAFKSGSLEITGNYFDPGCGDDSVSGYSQMLDFGEPTHNGNHIAEAVLHNIYIGDNVNATDPWHRLLWVNDYDYEGETKFVAYNLFVDDYTSSPEVVSSDFFGSEEAGIVASGATITQGKRCVLYVWYDNEYGYSTQVIRILQHISGLELPYFPK